MHPFLRIAPAATLLLTACVGGDPCATRPGSGGLFGGLNSMATGSGAQCLQQMSAVAGMGENEARLGRDRLYQANINARDSSVKLRAAQERLRALDATLNRQRDEVARLRSERGAQAGNVQRLLTQVEARRDAVRRTSTTPSEEDLRRLEQQSHELDTALGQFGAS